jgi:hypothetical protein
MNDIHKDQVFVFHTFATKIEKSKFLNVVGLPVKGADFVSKRSYLKRKQTR